MANVLKMADVNAIETLLARGWSRRRIARELGLHRDTVARYAARLAGDVAKQATISLTGGEGLGGARSGDSADERAFPADFVPPEGDSKPAIPLTGSPGRPSHCTAFAAAIQDKVDRGLSAQRIFQDLVSDQGFAGSYSSVQRHVRRLHRSTPLPFRRMECQPGEEAQVDFGQGAPTRRLQSKVRRRPHPFRIVLSFSRKGYTEVVWQQTTEEFIRCLENACHRRPESA